MSFEEIRSKLHKNISLYRVVSNVYYLYMYPVQSKILYLLHYKRKTVTFFPHKPHPMEVLYKVFHRLGYSITNDPTAPSELIIHYEDATFRTYSDIKEKFSTDKVIINRFCTNISKKFVDKTFQDVFGYSISISPETYTKPYVKKSNLNAQHNGVIIHSPEIAHPDFVYQKVIHNQSQDMVIDMRAPIIMGIIPFVYKKYRPIRSRFSNTNSYVEVARTSQTFSTVEIGKIRRFAQQIGMDYGELDILRDADEDKIYIVDANNTPSGPPNHLTKRDANRALECITQCISKYMLTGH